MSTRLSEDGTPRQGVDHEVERRLVEQARTDPLAFGRLFDAYYDRILNYLLHRTADVYVAQEPTSNVFYNAMKSIGKVSLAERSYACDGVYFHKKRAVRLIFGRILCTQ